MATALRLKPLGAFYNVLNPVPFGFFVTALVFDATHFATMEVVQGKSTAWLIGLGLLFAILPCVVDLCRVWLLWHATIVATARVSSPPELTGIVLTIFSAFVRNRGVHTMMPVGLRLSTTAVLLLALGEALLAVPAEEVTRGQPPLAAPRRAYPRSGPGQL